MNIPSPAKLYNLAFVPNQWFCPKCGFVLTKNAISAQTGEIGHTETCRQSEPCPNDGTWLEQMTWRESCQSANKAIDFWSEKAISLKEAIQSLIAGYEMKLENAERYDHGDELIYEDMIKKLKELVG